MAAAVLRERLKDRSDLAHILVDSAGTACRNPGLGPDPRASAALRARGMDCTGHRQRQFIAADFMAFDLILAMDRAILGQVSRLAPPELAGKVRLLLEFAQDGDTVEIPDPWDGGPDDYDRSLELIVRGIDGLIDRLERGPAHVCSSS
jgi:protein-tyrosine phosphatase